MMAASSSPKPRTLPSRCRSAASVLHHYHLSSLGGAPFPGAAPGGRGRLRQASPGEGGLAQAHRQPDRGDQPGARPDHHGGGRAPRGQVVAEELRDPGAGGTAVGGRRGRRGGGGRGGAGGGGARGGGGRGGGAAAASPAAGAAIAPALPPSTTRIAAARPAVMVTRGHSAIPAA